VTNVSHFPGRDLSGPGFVWVGWRQGDCRCARREARIFARDKVEKKEEESQVIPDIKSWKLARRMKRGVCTLSEEYGCCGERVKRKQGKGSRVQGLGSRV